MEGSLSRRPRVFSWMVPVVAGLIILATLPGSASARKRKSGHRTDRILTERNNGQKIFVQAGDLFWVRLRERAMKHGVWELMPLVGNHVALVRETADYKETWRWHWFKQRRTGGHHIWTFRAGEPGVYTLAMELVRLDKNRTKDTWAVTLIVTEPQKRELPAPRKPTEKKEDEAKASAGDSAPAKAEWQEEMLPQDEPK